MTRYISEPVRTDRAAIRDEIETALIAAVPGLEIAPLTLLDFLVDTFASTSAEDRELLTEVLAIIFRYSGEKIDRVAQRQAVAATAPTTWERTAADELAVGPRTVPAGTEVNVRGADGELVAFRTTTAFTFADGVTSTSPGVVELVAVDPGAAGNGLTAVIGSAQTVTWFQSVTFTAPSSGGVDAETDDEYLDRLADTRPLQSQAIKTGDDLARWLRNQPGVYRAMALDNYRLDTETANVPGFLSGIPIAADGSAVSAPVMAALELVAQQITLTNLFVGIGPPSDNAVTIAFTGFSKRGWDATDVQDRAEDAVAALLDRVNWGAPDEGDRRPWTETLVLRYQDVSWALNAVPGFDHHTVLTINGVADDLALDGPGALPAPSPTITGTVTAL